MKYILLFYYFTYFFPFVKNNISTRGKKVKEKKISRDVDQHPSNTIINYHSRHERTRPS